MVSYLYFGDGALSGSSQSCGMSFRLMDPVAVKNRITVFLATLIDEAYQNWPRPCRTWRGSRKTTPSKCLKALKTAPSFWVWTNSATSCPIRASRVRIR